MYNPHFLKFTNSRLAQYTIKCFYNQTLSQGNGIQLKNAVLPNPIPDQAEYNRLKAYQADHQ